MHPEPHHFLLAPMNEGLHHLDASDDASHIAQIEQVVRLCGCGPEILLSILEDIDASVDDLAESFGSIDSHETFPSDVIVDDLAKNTRHALFVKVGTRDDIEVSCEARRDWILASSWRAHRSNDDNVGDLLQLVTLVRVVVPLSMVHPLPE